MASDAFWAKIRELVGVVGPAGHLRKRGPSGNCTDWMAIAIPGFGTWDFENPVTEKDEGDVIEMLKIHLAEIKFKRTNGKKKRTDC